MKYALLALAVLAVAGGAGLYYLANYETIEHTEMSAPPPKQDPWIEDDKLEEKRPPAFDPAMAAPLDSHWLVNDSAAVIRLDIALVRPDLEPDLSTLHSSYAAAARGRRVLPSVNMIDGKAKQFDDGLVAALELGFAQRWIDLMSRLHAGAGTPAAPFLAAGLKLAGVEVEPGDVAARDRYLAEFNANPVASKPIGFYTWTPELSECFRFLRFFQRKSNPVMRAVEAALAQDAALKADYEQELALLQKRCNPFVPGASLLPPSTSREQELLESLFPMGLPAGADLMGELVRAIRSGKVDLTPTAAGGWYDHQVYALETMLLPGRGPEGHKLLLTKSYKKRMLEAFEALITKRRETHVRQLGIAVGSATPAQVAPRLRVEPCPSFYLRTARAYAFIASVLGPVPGHGLREGGERPMGLREELVWMRDLFFGLYLVSAEDIGLKPEEPVDDRCRDLAIEWLKTAVSDPDLAVDTRVSTPIYQDFNKTRLWATLGVRLAKLEASYATAPSLKRTNGSGEWQPAPGLGTADYLIPVDEFAEVELAGKRVLTRAELRTVCDLHKARAEILGAIR